MSLYLKMTISDKNNNLLCIGTISTQVESNCKGYYVMVMHLPCCVDYLGGVEGRA